MKLEQFTIAGLKTEYAVRGELLRQRSENYRGEFEKADICLSIKEDFITEKQKKIPYLTWEEHEYMLTCEAFYHELLRFGGIMLHSSCVDKDGRAYLFSARSGTGKSTHTHLWLKAFPGARIINDDKPALIRENGVWYACGTPFSGKTDENIDEKVPVRAVVFIHRSEANEVERLEPQKAVPLFLNQTITPANRDLALNMLTNLDCLLREVPLFSLGCNMEDEAARVSYNEIERMLK